MKELVDLRRRFHDLCLRASEAGMKPWSYAIHGGRLQDRELVYQWRAIYDHSHAMTTIGIGVRHFGRQWIVAVVGDSGVR